MYEFKNIGKVFTSKCLGTGPSSYEKRIYWAAVSQRLRNTDLEDFQGPNFLFYIKPTAAMGPTCVLFNG